jgi:hypothetical protein
MFNLKCSDSKASCFNRTIEMSRRLFGWVLVIGFGVANGELNVVISSINKRQQY